MNVLNRVLIVILLLVVIVSCSIVLVAPVSAFGWISGWSRYLTRYFGTVEAYTPAWFGQKALGVLFALALDIVLVLIIILEVRRPAPKAIRVERAAGGEVMVSVASISDRLKYEIDQLGGVLRVKPKVSAKRRGIVVELDVQTAAGIDVPERADRIVETARLVVEEKLGLRLARPPKVSLRTVRYPRTPVVPAEPKEVLPVLADDDRLPGQKEGDELDFTPLPVSPSSPDSGALDKPETELLG